MRGYTEIRTLTGKKIFVRMSREEIREQRLFKAEIILLPLLTVFVFAKAAGMI